MNQCVNCGEYTEGGSMVTFIDEDADGFLCDLCIETRDDDLDIALIIDGSVDIPCYDGGEHILNWDDGLCIYCGCSESTLNHLSDAAEA